MPSTCLVDHQSCTILADQDFKEAARLAAEAKALAVAAEGCTAAVAGLEQQLQGLEAEEAEARKELSRLKAMNEVSTSYLIQTCCQPPFTQWPAHSLAGFDHPPAAPHLPPPTVLTGYPLPR